MHLWEVVIRILIAAVLAGVIGFEREIREHTAGFRTHILVAVGSAAFTLASSYGLTGTSFDPNRISAQVVTGIGFLGAGAIIRYGVSVRGLTTAASLWTVAAVGLLSAQGFFSAALVTTGVVIVSLTVLRLIEDRILYARRGREIPVRVHFSSPGYAPLAQLVDRLQQAHVVIKEMGVAPEDNDRDTIRLLLDLPRTLDAAKVTALIADLNEVRAVRVD
jgi:putative Mg2+ transporter-C (MgtC) family protein